ncbi:MAG: hypothetical protein L0Z50_41405 [Verrucomicrobiales bacterium]|nr:hypothetical protein [Verrucomicrobiales bacterium]
MRCGDALDKTGDSGIGNGVAPGGRTAGTNQPIPEAQLAAITNQFATALTRIEQLETKDAERVTSVQAAQKAHEEQVKVHEHRAEKLVRQIAELESKVGSLQAGRVLPEIALTPDDPPTTRELDQKIRIAERKNELPAEAAKARAKEQPRLSVGTSGFALSSADTNLSVKLHGHVQLDSRTFFDDNPLSEGNDSFILRRAHR